MTPPLPTREEKKEELDLLELEYESGFDDGVEMAMKISGKKDFLIDLLGRLEYDKIRGKIKLDYFRDKYMSSLPIKEEKR